MYKSLALAVTVCGISACTFTSTSVAQPKLWQVSYQFCIPDEITNQLGVVISRGAAPDGKCTRSFKPIAVWAENPPEVALLIDPPPMDRKSNPWNHYQVAIKANGCLSSHQELGEKGWYSANHRFMLKKVFSQDKPMIPVVETKIEPVANVTIDNTSSVPYLPMSQSCQFLGSVSEN